MQEYILKPITTPATVALTSAADKPALVKFIPPRQPLPTAVIDPTKPMLKLGLDVHLECIMAVAQRPRQSTRASQVQSRTTRRPGAEVGRRRFSGLLCGGKLRLRLCAPPRTDRRRRAKFPHHPHRPEWPAQDRQARRAGLVPAPLPLARWQPG